MIKPTLPTLWSSQYHEMKELQTITKAMCSLVAISATLKYIALFIIQYIINVYFVCTFYFLLGRGSFLLISFGYLGFCDVSNAFVNERTKGLTNGMTNGFLCHPTMALAQIGHDVRPWTQSKQRFAWPH